VERREQLGTSRHSIDTFAIARPMYNELRIGPTGDLWRGFVQSHNSVYCNIRRSTIILQLLVIAIPLIAQCTGDDLSATGVKQSFEARDWNKVVLLAEPLTYRSADIDYEYGVALAHLQRWPEAQNVLNAGQRQCPLQKRFAIELAGVAFEKKQYPEAAARLQSALHLDPTDSYVNDFSGSVYFLMGNLEAALKYWNRIHKPYISKVHLDPNLRIQRLLLDRAFAYSPAAVLRESDFNASNTRLQGLGIYPTYNVTLAARSDGTFDAEFHAVEHDGFGGNHMQALVSTFAGVAYETIYPSYFNINGTATNIESLLRWDSQKRRADILLSAPFRDLPQWRWQLSFDARDENWTIQPSFTGSVSPQGSLNLQSLTFSARMISFTNGRFQWLTGGNLSHNSYNNVRYGPALTPQLLLSGFELKHLGAITYKLLDIPERRFATTISADSEFARLLSNPPCLFEKLQASAVTSWLPQKMGESYEIEQKVRAGRIFGAEPFDELFMLGIERDNDLWLRGEMGTRNGRKGSAPLGSNYTLSNTDVIRTVYNNGLFGVKAGPIFDIGRASGAAIGLSTRQWLFDTGAEAKIKVLGSTFVLIYGHDLRSGNNTVFVTMGK